MEESILTSIKKLLGLSEDCNSFDKDIIMHINTVFVILNQLGVGPENVFMIEDEKTVWKDFMNDDKKLNAVKSYIHLKVKLIFDPPLSSAVIEANKQMINELEWRLNNNSDYK